MIDVYKFGGASVRDAESIRRVGQIIRDYQGNHLVVVVSAMDKTTNALEKLLEGIRSGAEINAYKSTIQELHKRVMEELKLDSELGNSLFDLLTRLIAEVQKIPDPAQQYDHLVSWGEIASTRIIDAFLAREAMPVVWIDARSLIRTDSSYRQAIVDFPKTQAAADANLTAPQKYLTQGFIGSDDKGHTTTLGREGSDYTASILAGCLNARRVTTWKDVNGIMNADPKRFPSTVVYPELSYQEVAEMTFYGAKVIHPKTIQPLANKGIPLHVRSFLDRSAPGTLIHHTKAVPDAPAIITKAHQMLITFHSRDLSFITEKKISIIFFLLAEHQISLNLMQSSATSFTICIDNYLGKGHVLVENLKNDFRVRYNENLELFTIKNYTQQLVKEISKGKEILLEQVSRSNFQFVTRP